jgi:REP element-mobilizing transposase RayT
MFASFAGAAFGRAYLHGMGRRPREFGEGIYHVGSHGSDLRHLFLDDNDRVTFLERLALIVARFELALAAYTLMGNHYHLLVATPDARLSQAIQQLHGWYARRHNKSHSRGAHLFRAHFFAREIRSDDDLLSTCRYVAHNPVAAGLCETPFDWPWSSVAATAGLAPPAIPLETGPIRAAPRRSPRLANPLPILHRTTPAHARTAAARLPRTRCMAIGYRAAALAPPAAS